MHDPYWKQAAAIMRSDARYLRLPGDVRSQLIQDFRAVMLMGAYHDQPDVKELTDLGCRPLFVEELVDDRADIE